MVSRLNGLAWLAGATVLSVCLSVPALADEPAAAVGDPALGAKKFYTCYGCHGIENYKNAYPNYPVPKLRHQHASYIVAALQEYKSGARPHPTMHAQASSLSDQDMADIAAYLESGTEGLKDASAAKVTPPPVVAQCAACHGETGLSAQSMQPTPPILAGQHADYLTQALTAYHNGRRKNVVMNGMSQLLKTPDDIRAAAEYFSSQASPLATATVKSK